AASEVADFHIYRATPDGALADGATPGALDLGAANCGLRDGAAVESTCGWCTCDPQYGLICVDYTCTPTEALYDADVDYVDDELKPAISCEDGDGNAYDAGESWKDDCNVCTCQASGQIVCTLMTCEPQPR